MPLKQGKEVIGGVLVIRFNGNNSSGAGSSRGSSAWAKVIRQEKITAWRKAKAKRSSASREYEWRYLGGS